MKPSAFETDDWDIGDGSEDPILQSIDPALTASPVKPQPQPAQSLPDVVKPAEPIPDNLRDLFAEMERIENWIPKTRAEELARHARREKVGKRLVEVQNGTKPPVYTAHDHAQMMLAQANLHLTRKQRLEQLAKTYPAVRALLGNQTSFE
jgi:hypothetical protein